MLRWLSRRVHTLFVVAGQSNAHGGYGNAGDYPADEQGVDALIPLYYSAPGYSDCQGQWGRLSPQYGMFATKHFGPEIALARMARACGYRPAMFKFTKPSSSLFRDWKAPGENGLYDAMCRELAVARKRFPNSLGRLKTGGLIWIQGESDAETDEYVSAYENHLERLVIHFRRFLRIARLPVVLSVNEEHPWVLERPAVVTAQQRIVSRHTRMAFSSMTGLPKQPDSHLTAKGLVEHGERLFRAYRDIDRRGLGCGVFCRQVVRAGLGRLRSRDRRSHFVRLWVP